MTKEEIDVVMAALDSESIQIRKLAGIAKRAIEALDRMNHPVMKLSGGFRGTAPVPMPGGSVVYLEPEEHRPVVLLVDALLKKWATLRQYDTVAHLEDELEALQKWRRS